MKRVKLKYAFAALILLSTVLMCVVPKAKANTFYQTFISSCESEEWFISFINSKFIENGKRFSDLTSADDATLLNITELKFPAGGITKIPAAVKYLKNLSRVDLSYNDIEDLSPLYSCSAIMVLNVDGNLLSTVSTGSFSRLTELSAAYNRLCLMPDVSANKQLRILNLSGNNIDKTTSLEGLTALSFIDLSGNLISSAELGSFSMKSYQNQAMLDISYNRLANLGFLSGISGLKTLNVSNNFISSKLSSIPLSVVTLDISNNGLTDASELSRLVNLVNLNISGNLLTETDGLKGCTALVTLDASSNRISQTTGLDSLTKLYNLNLSNNLLQDMPLHTLLKNLSVFDISYNNISNVALVNRYTNITHFYASHNKITDFSAINDMNLLTVADFSYNSISEAYPKLYLTTPKLNVLKLSGNSFSKSELANVLANGYSEIWLCDMDLENKIPDMSAYTGIYELYVNGSKLSADDIRNVLKKNDYTGLGLGGIITSEIAEKLGKQTELITLDVSGTKNTELPIDKIAALNIINLNMSDCDKTSFAQELLGGSIKNIDFTNNLLVTVSDDILRKAVSAGIKIDFSGNTMICDHIFYAYLKNFGFKFDGAYLDFNYGTVLESDSEPEKVTVNTKIDLYALLSLKNIYSNAEIALPGREYFSAELIDGDPLSVTLDKDGLLLTVNKEISVLDTVKVNISFVNSKRKDLCTELVIYTNELPLNYETVAGAEIICGIELGTTFGELFDKFALRDAFEFKALNSAGEVIPNTNLAGTGSKIQIIKDGNVVLEKTVLIIGDCSGDGKINSTDFMMIKMHIFNQKLLEGVYFEAADINGNGAVNSTDFMRVKLFIFNQGTIPQVREKTSE